jgi:hypothetical protein
MIVLFAIAAWILSLWLVTALCWAARRGDVQEHSDPLAEPAGEPIERFVIIRQVAADPCGGATRSEPVGRSAVHQAEDGSSRSENPLPRHAQTPADLALQPG